MVSSQPKLDKLNRRSRRDIGRPLKRRIELQKRDHIIFEALRRHGPLSTNFLFEFIRGLRPNYNHHQHRLRELCDGSIEDPRPHLIRPPQLNPHYALSQPSIYDLAPRTTQMLATERRPAPIRTDHYVHRFMGACVSSSIELTAKQFDVRYIGREEIFQNPKCPETTRRQGNPLALPIASFERKAVVPDDLFGLQYTDGGFAFFAVEIDRHTESIERSNPSQTAFAKKIAGYFEILREGRFRANWGIPNLTILTVTTNARHAESLVAYLERQCEPTLAPKFFFRTDNRFDAAWRVPRALLSELITAPWTTTRGTAVILKQ